MKIYTKNGDNLTTSLPGCEAVAKNDCRINFIGEIDELNCYLGLLKNLNCNDLFRDYIGQAQKKLSVIMGNVIGEGAAIADCDISDIEQRIDFLQGLYSGDSGFIVPGGCMESAVIDICRTVARRAERSLCEVSASGCSVDCNTKKYLNRLSDYLFAAARYADGLSGTGEEMYE